MREGSSRTAVLLPRSITSQDVHLLPQLCKGFLELADTNTEVNTPQSVGTAIGDLKVAFNVGVSARATRITSRAA
jgi:hypothetical protein